MSEFRTWLRYEWGKRGLEHLLDYGDATMLRAARFRQVQTTTV